MEMSFGSALTAIGKVLDIIRDRPSVRITPRLADYGEPVSGIVTWRVGLIVDVEVHSTGPQAVEIREIGLELDGQRKLPFRTTSTQLPTILTRPEHVTASLDLRTIKETVGVARALAFYVLASPDRTFRHALRGPWTRFPHELPPTDSGREGPGFFFGSTGR
jgi:hypothetical protein